MAEPVGKAVLDVVQADCKSLTCPYRGGDGEPLRTKFKAKIEKKLEYRVADGNEVRALNKRIKALETALEKVLEQASSRKLTAKEIIAAKSALLPAKKETQ